MRPFRVVVAAEIHPPTIGGPASYAVALETELQRRAVDVRVVSYTPYARGNSRTRRWVGLHLGKTQRTLAYLDALVCPPIPTVVFALGTVTAGLPALLACRKLGIPLVLRCPGDYAWEVAQRDGGTDRLEEYRNRRLPKKIKLIGNIQMQVCRAANKIIVPCPFLRHHFAAMGVEDTKIHVVPNAPLIPREALRSEVPREVPHFLYVGRFVVWKGLEAIISAFHGFSKTVPSARLTLIGDGPDCASIASRIADLNLRERVSLLGPLSRHDVLQHMRRASALILNSTYECCTNVAVEALAMGTPVISARTDGNQEILIDGVNALLFEQGDSDALQRRMSQIWLDGALRVFLGQRTARSLTFTFEEMIDSTLWVLQEASASRIAVFTHGK